MSIVNDIIARRARQAYIKRSMIEIVLFGTGIALVSYTLGWQVGVGIGLIAYATRR